jgi:hypothetical protein
MKYEQITKEEIQDKINNKWGIERTKRYYKNKFKIITPEVITNVINYEYSKTI